MKEPGRSIASIVMAQEKKNVLGAGEKAAKSVLIVMVPAEKSVLGAGEKAMRSVPGAGAMELIHGEKFVHDAMDPGI